MSHALSRAACAAVPHSCRLHPQHHLVSVKPVGVRHRLLEVTGQSSSMAGTLPPHSSPRSCSSVIPLHRNRFSLMFRLPQVDPSAFDALLRQMPDIVIDFSSAIPARARARALCKLCVTFGVLAGGVRRQHPHDAWARIGVYCQGQAAARVLEGHTGAVQAVVLEHAAAVCAHAQVSCLRRRWCW